MLRAALVIAIAALPLAAQAQSYRCTGKDGKKYYGQNMPMECLGQPVEMLNAQGMVIKRYDAQASAAEREKKAADEEERKKREAASKEEGRRNRALLATYTSDKDIDQTRARALKDNEDAVKDIEKRVAGLKTRLAEQKKELDFYSGKTKPPAKLADDIRNTEFDINTQEGLMASKKKEVDQINARFNEDKKRYAELTGLDLRERASRSGEAKSLTIGGRPDLRAGSAPSAPSQAVGAASAERHTVMCGNTTIVCTARSTVTCGGRVIPCQ